jgi:hypothetical protein
MPTIKVPEEDRPDSLEPISAVVLEDGELGELASAARARDAQRFEQLLGSINWKLRTASDILGAVDLALSLGAYDSARGLAAIGRELHPNHEEIEKHAHVLAPPRVIRRNLQADSSIRANRTWLIVHGDEYRGKWVAVKDGTLVGYDDSLDELTKRIGADNDILLTTVF